MNKTAGDSHIHTHTHTHTCAFLSVTSEWRYHTSTW